MLLLSSLFFRVLLLYASVLLLVRRIVRLLLDFLWQSWCFTCTLWNPPVIPPARRFSGGNLSSPRPLALE